ncbi:Cheerio / Filamin-A/C -like protein [Leptotrombidium deliense]|uniref:Cheerio / Filamin-A/C-like protein n=1 Tax=Leptotrombidium deliense TaxID=299467 RepID=A0A443SQG5_9ACAR|nr:Cheerio / Filamin-A/C -like protein [Leptotrombidium deliense]
MTRELNANVIAVGPGLVIGRTGEVNHFNVYFSNRSNESKQNVEFFMEGPSEPVPLQCIENSDDGSIGVSYSPILSGEYKIHVRCSGQHIDGSPFNVSVAGESIRQNLMACRVAVTGEALKSAKMRKENVIFIDIGDAAISGGLKVSIAGPRNAKASLKMSRISDTKHKVTFTPTERGVYFLFIKVGDTNVPNSPFSMRVT